jgi:2'-5' RNA ligase
MLLAIDVVLLPPAEVGRMAIALNRALPPAKSQGLVLDDTCVPHVTLAQLFVAAGRLDAVLERVADVAAETMALPLRVTGGARGSSSVWMGVGRSPAIVALHERLMTALEPFEAPGGDTAAFAGHDARPGDIRWVANFRADASFERFVPHITLGHARTPPYIEPFEFEATTLAVCRLGRFCTCRHLYRKWDVRSE